MFDRVLRACFYCKLVIANFKLQIEQSQQLARFVILFGYSFNHENTRAGTWQSAGER
jgi:hypothetical protein